MNLKYLMDEGWVAAFLYPHYVGQGGFFGVAHRTTLYPRVQLITTGAILIDGREPSIQEFIDAGAKQYPDHDSALKAAQDWRDENNAIDWEFEHIMKELAS